MACGCTVFSSLNDALSDYLDPSFNSHKLRVYSQEFDRSRILSAVKNWRNNSNLDLIEKYRISTVKERFIHILSELNLFFDHQLSFPENISPLKIDRFHKLSKLINKLGFS